MNNFATKIFKYRSYTPIPFLILTLVFQNATQSSLIVGFSIALLGELFRMWGVSYAGSETRTTGGVGGTYLVVSGAYAFVRNPLYLGNILLYLGFGIASMALFPYLQIFAFLFFYMQYIIIIKEEEKYLSQRFMPYYNGYRNFVPRLMPNFIKYRNPGVEQPPFNFKAGLKSETRTLQAIALIIFLILIRYAIS